ncbi:MAG: hypothetical protein O2960_21620 [Verrucomicrobia bacterium]|nr:hypothetical protein [Verrucomicrobiota bacterium]
MEKSIFAAACLTSLANKHPKILNSLLGHPNRHVREIALYSLPGKDPIHVSEMPLIVSCLHDPSVVVRWLAGRYINDFLTELRAHSPKLLEEFRKRLDAESTQRETMSCSLLKRVMTMVGEFGAEAQPALPELYALQNSPETEIKRHATTIIQSIEKSFRLTE